MRSVKVGSFLMNERGIILETEGFVISKNGDNAVVEIQRVSACTGDCKDCAGCETKKMQVTVHTDFDVLPGERVKISSEERSVLFGLFVVFIVPLLLPLMGYLLAANSGFGGWFAAAGLVVSLVLIRQLSRSRWYLKKTQPIIVKVISEKRGKE